MKSRSKRTTDRHVARCFSSLVTIESGRVIKVTKPDLSHCPVAGFLYDGMKGSSRLSAVELKALIKKTVEGKIARFGFCTKDRILWQDGPAIPYGASEILAHGLRTKTIDGAVTVCDGAGTVVAAIPQVVQGIGARMHTMLKTSPIPEVAVALRRYGCHVVSAEGAIDQGAGVIEASRKGHKTIGVTVSAFGKDDPEVIRAVEKRYGVAVTILAICTTGVRKKRLAVIEKYADIIWACHSRFVKERLAAKAISVISGVSPVYILTEKGLRLVAGYAPSLFGIRKEKERSGAS